MESLAPGAASGVCIDHDVSADRRIMIADTRQSRRKRLRLARILIVRDDCLQDGQKLDCITFLDCKVLAENRPRNRHRIFAQSRLGLDRSGSIPNL